MQTKVFFNNSCNICRVEINHYKKHADETIEWIDISNNQNAEIITSRNVRPVGPRFYQTVVDVKISKN